jgi:hypothetical protein
MATSSGLLDPKTPIPGIFYARSDDIPSKHLLDFCVGSLDLNFLALLGEDLRDGLLALDDLSHVSEDFGAGVGKTEAGMSAQRDFMFADGRMEKGNR